MRPLSEEAAHPEIDEEARAPWARICHSENWSGRGLKYGRMGLQFAMLKSLPCFFCLSGATILILAGQGGGVGIADGDGVEGGTGGAVWARGLQISGVSRGDTFGAGMTGRDALDEERRGIAARLEFSGGGGLLGTISVLESDFLEMSDGSSQRHSIIRGSSRGGCFLAIERFDEDGRPTFATFHSAERVAVRFPDMHSLRGAMSTLANLGLGWTVPLNCEFYPVAEFKTPPDAEEIFEIFLTLHKAVGGGGVVTLVDVHSGGEGREAGLP